MFSNKRPDGGPSEFSHAQGDATVIARGVKLQGDFTSQGDVVIDGEVQGHVETAGQLTVGGEAKLKADVAAGDAMIAGTVEGTLTVKRRLELKSTARILGDVTCETASIEAGAALDGKVSIGGAGRRATAPTPDAATEE